MTYDLKNKNRYTVWACTPDKPDRVYATGLTEWDADMVANEMNSIDDEADYRVCIETADAIAMDAFQEHVVLTNQEWGTPNYYTGFWEFKNQVHDWLMGEEVTPNSCIEVPLSLIESVGQQLVDEEYKVPISELYSEYIAHTTN